MSLRMMRWAGVAALTAMLGMTVVACGTNSASPSTSGHTLAVVNGQDVTRSDWMLAVNATDLIQQVNMSTGRSAEKKQVKELASELAVEQYALRHHWVTPAKAASEAKLYISENVMAAYGGAAKAKPILAKKHLSTASLGRFMTQQMELQAAFARAVKGISKPTMAQMDLYYKAHKSVFTSPAQDEMRMILVKKKSLAQSLLNQLKHGASWHTLADKYSLDTYSKKKGGEYGWVSTGPQSGFVTPFYTEMDKLKPGQYGIAHSQYGYHVIEVQATRPGKVSSFASVKSELSSGLLRLKQNAAFQKFTQKVAKHSRITIRI